MAVARNTEHVLRMHHLVLVMVGLPARGKSYITHKLTRYMNWMGFTARVFNAGEKRRTKLGAGQSNDFFDASNSSSSTMRDAIAMETLEELLEWVSGPGYVGIFDATNTTLERRAAVLERCLRHFGSDPAASTASASPTGLAAKPPVEVVFIESICDDPVILNRNYDMKLSNADYKGQDPVAARADFLARVAKYEKVYEPIDAREDKLSYIKILNVGQRVTINRCSGYLVSQISSCLCNMHIEPRFIWLLRHGQSEDNACGVIGGDSHLTPAGHDFARRVAAFVETVKPKQLLVWTSTLKRTKETARYLKTIEGVCVYHTPLLNEIDAGICDGLTYDQVAAQYPDEYAARQADKLGYRYPGGGESYIDVIERVKPLILELERIRDPVLIIAHQAVLRTLLAYFTDESLSAMVHLKVPLHALVQLEPAAYDCNKTVIELGPEVKPHAQFSPKVSYLHVPRDEDDDERGSPIDSVGEVPAMDAGPDDEGDATCLKC